MGLTHDEWAALKGKRAEIEAALQALGMPICGWMNGVPMFKEPYKPDWDQIENIATAVNAKGAKEWPPYIKQTVKVAEKAKVPKKVVKGVANGKGKK